MRRLISKVKALLALATPLDARALLRGALVAVSAAALGFSAPAQVQEAKLTAFDAFQADLYGTAVALSPDWAFVSAPYDDVGNLDSGSLYSYQRAGSSWTFAQKLVGFFPNTSMNLGASLATSGPWLLAGSPYAVYSSSNSGGADIYKLEGGTWEHSQVLIPSDIAVAYHVGTSAAISGDRLVLGGVEENGYTGSARVFELSGSSWVQVAKLSVPGGADQYFGFDVAIQGDTIVVSEPGDDGVTPNSNVGAVHVFERNTQAVWQLAQTLLPGDVHPNQFFGDSVAIDGDTILVGSAAHTHAATTAAGALYVFERQGGTWVETAELRASDPQIGLNLGQHVDIEGNLAVGGATPDADHGANSGSAYVFRRNAPGAWVQIAKAIAPDAAPSTELGSAVALSGTRLLIGARRDDWACPANPFTCNVGSVYVFRVALDSVQFGSCPTQGPCGNHDDFGGCVNSSGRGGELSAAGSSSVSADDLHLQARRLPAGKLGIFFMGGLPTSIPFGDGQLCVTSGGFGVWRFNPPQSTGAQGVMDLGPGVVGLSSSFPPGGQIAPGHIWHYQAWFRDPAGPCGQGSNMTNAVRVNFAP